MPKEGLVFQLSSEMNQVKNLLLQEDQTLVYLAIHYKSGKRWKSKIKSLPITKKNARTFQRFFFSGATEVEIDKQGRINIPNALIEHAFLDKECVVNGLSNRIEIWDKNRWEDLLVESEASVEEIAEELEDFDFQDG